jgi:hypothetical protein
MFDTVDGVDLDGRGPAGSRRAEELTRLRARMAATGRVGGTSVLADPDAGPGPPMARNVIDIEAAGLGAILPAGGLVRGSVVGCVGSGSVLAGLLASVTRAGEWAAVVGAAQLGLLAVAEMGGHLPRLAHIPDPGVDPVGVAMALLDGQFAGQLRTVTDGGVG